MKYRPSRAVSQAAVLAAVVVFGVLGVTEYRRLRRSAESIEQAPQPSEPRMRVPLWVDPADLRLPPRFVFTWESPEALTRLRLSEKLEEVVAGAADDEQRARLLMGWVRGQFQPGRPDPYPPPNAEATLEQIRSGRTGGFCAQYSFVLVQASQSLGVPARCVTIRDHEVTEVWLQDQQRWSMFDPTLSLQLLDATGRSLSALEIHRAGMEGLPLRPLRGHRLEEEVESYATRYERFAVWLHNAFTSRPMNFRDLSRYRVWFEPEPESKAWTGVALRTSFADELYGVPRLPVAEVQ